MRQFIALIAILSFITLGFRETLIVSFYEMNKEYITKNFCVNKDKPEMECDGKCHMKKMLKKSKDKQEESFPEGTLEVKFISYLKPYFHQEYCKNDFIPPSLFSGYIEQLKSNLFFHNIFHPPQV